MQLPRVLDTLTRRWWFYLLLLALFFLPSITARPLDPRDSSQMITAVMANALIYSYPAVFPVFKVLPLLLLGAILLWGDRATRLFDGYVACTIILFALLQNSALTEEYGLAVVTGNVAVYTLVALLWFWETGLKRNVLAIRRQPLWRYWVVPLAFLAFWFPLDQATLRPDFSPLLILTSNAGLTGCMMIPCYLAIVVLFAQSANRVVIRVTGFAGLITALVNMVQWLVLSPHPWLAVLHLPLLSISLYAWIGSLAGEQLRPEAPHSGVWRGNAGTA